MEHNCVPIKLILKKYGYERIGINNVSKLFTPLIIYKKNFQFKWFKWLNGYFNFFQKLIHCIIKENHESMISDIEQITKNDLLSRKKAFSSCVNYYLVRG